MNDQSCESADDLANLFNMRATAEDLYRAVRNEANPYGIIFGGQILGQTIAAAQATVEGKVLHSLHANFVKAGRAELPSDYSVDRVRDGRELATRIVRGTQGSAVMVVATCSFRDEHPGFAHHRQQTETLAVEDAIPFVSLAQQVKPEQRPLIDFMAHRPAIEVRVAGLEGFIRRGPQPRRNYWVRVRDPVLARVEQRRLFAYLSDLLLSGAPLVTHIVPLPNAGLRAVSLDHAIWFHGQPDCSRWLLFETESPAAANGASLTLCWVYDEDGKLVATLAQEALQNLV